MQRIPHEYLKRISEKSWKSWRMNRAPEKPMNLFLTLPGDPILDRMLQPRSQPSAGYSTRILWMPSSTAQSTIRAVDPLLYVWLADTVRSAWFQIRFHRSAGHAAPALHHHGAPAPAQSHPPRRHLPVADSQRRWNGRVGRPRTGRRQGVRPPHEHHLHSQRGWENGGDSKRGAPAVQPENGPVRSAALGWRLGPSVGVDEAPPGVLRHLVPADLVSHV